MTKRPTLKRKDDRVGIPPSERILTSASVLFTVLLVGYALWQSFAAPEDAPPEAHVTGTQTLDTGEVAVHVEFVNPASVGLLSVEVEVECDEPPPSLNVANIPAQGRSAGTVVCPPGTASPNATVASWVEA